ncbi:MAG: type III-A CRISPR-associated RAMP protein Csm4 [Clostridium sp.]|nr:type III-A CRISPR-associated RAMP protein Csm4 [Clostridium sp.]
MRRNIVKLRFKTPLHVGTDEATVNNEASSRFIHSDTVFSCFLNSYCMLYGVEKTKEFIENCVKDKRGFVMTSAFPFSGDNYYVIMPVSIPPYFENPKFAHERWRYYKKVKEYSFIEIEHFIEFRDGKEVIPEDWGNQSNECCSEEIRPRVQIDRISSDAGLYHVGVVHFERDAGLYLLLEYDDRYISESCIRDTFKNAGIYGIGGLRSSGCGHFEADLLPFTEDFENLISGSDNVIYNGHISLSLVYPDLEAQDYYRPVAYNLCKREGWTYSSFENVIRKRGRLYFYSEGSVFEDKPKGCLYEYKDYKDTVHPYYRYGIGFYIPFKIVSDVGKEVDTDGKARVI